MRAAMRRRASRFSGPALRIRERVCDRRAPHATLSVRITSPLGRTGLAGPIRLVAQVQQHDNVRLKPVKFYIDDALFGEAESGPAVCARVGRREPVRGPRNRRRSVRRDRRVRTRPGAAETARDSRTEPGIRACYSKHPYRTRPVVTSAG